jgi:glycosyltransferase involved in cell wall biosynthesis
MIIAIDGYEANNIPRVGIGRYAYEILRHIYKRRQNIKDSQILFRIYLPELPVDDMPVETTWWKYKIVPFKKLWTFIGLPLALKIDKPHFDVCFSPTHYIPRFINHNVAMSVMDLSFLYYKDLFKKKDLYKLTNWTKYSIAHSNKIFTISQYSKDAIIKMYNLKPDHIIVTYPGIDNVKLSSMNKEDLLKKYQVSGNFILAVGTIQPRKNYIRLIEAFSIFLSKNKQKFRNINLVIIGKKGWMYDEILKTPQKFNVTDKVKFLDFVDDADLDLFYKYALCFVMPSLYEGFGLPVGEAILRSCPVVVSQVSSLPEVAGPAGIYINPLDANSIANGLLTAVRERNLIQGKTRIKMGLNHVKQFSWEKAAKMTLDSLVKLNQI